jgi:hypothetical protein
MKFGDTAVACVLAGFMITATHAAELDDWCAQVKKPSSIVICSDVGLRQLAIERNKAFADAHARLTAEAYKQLVQDQNRWISGYSQACGIPEDKPVQSPILSTVIECFRRAGQARVEYIKKYGVSTAVGAPTSLVSPSASTLPIQPEVSAAGRAAEAECMSRLAPTSPMQPSYYQAYMSNIQARCIQEGTAAAERVRSSAMERERTQRERDRERDREREREAEKQVALERAEREKQETMAAEEARKQLRAQAVMEREARISTKLKELGYSLISPTDLELDWRELRTASAKIAIRGIYADADDVEGLVVSNKDHLVIRLYSEDASRDTRKAMLECRNSDFAITKCRMIIGGNVVTCIRNKGKINEKELPCLHVQEAFVLSDDDTTSNNLKR